RLPASTWPRGTSVQACVCRRETLITWTLEWEFVLKGLDAILAAPVGRERLLVYRFHVAVDEEIIHGSENQHSAAEPEGNAMQLAFHEFLVLPHLDADIAKHRAPNRRSEQSVNGKGFVVHPHDASGNADQMAHD